MNLPAKKLVAFLANVYCQAYQKNLAHLICPLLALQWKEQCLDPAPQWPLVIIGLDLKKLNQCWMGVQID